MGFTETRNLSMEPIKPIGMPKKENVALGLSLRGKVGRSIHWSSKMWVWKTYVQIPSLPESNLPTFCQSSRGSHGQQVVGKSVVAMLLISHTEAVPLQKE